MPGMFYSLASLSVVACGYKKDMDGNHEITIYDENSYHPGSYGGYLTMKVSSDFKSFHFADSNSRFDDVCVEDLWKNLNYYGVDKIDNGGIQTLKMKSRMAAAAYQEDDQDQTTIQISANKRFRLQNEEALNGVVEDCVNKVGVDLNTASAPLLSYIAGISKAVAKNIVAYREENGRFHTRKELLKVPKLGPKAFLQCAGFLRIPGGEEPLDNTSVHPESYEAATKLLNDLGYTSESIRGGGLSSLNSQIKDEKGLAENLGIGEMTLHDIIEELEKPGRDPRSEMPP